MIKLGLKKIHISAIDQERKRTGDIWDIFVKTQKCEILSYDQDNQSSNGDNCKRIKVDK